MFRKMLGRSTRSKAVVQVPTNKIDLSKREKDQFRPSSSSTKNEAVADESMSKAERNLCKFTLPDDQMGFDDLVKQYSEGQRFQYVVLSGKDEETVAARIRRLVTLSPRINKKPLPLHSIPTLEIVDNEEQFNLSLAIPKKGPKYVRLAAVLGVFSPLSSVFQVFTKVTVSLHDTRLMSDTCVQSVKFNSNITQKFELSLDYCIARTDADQIVLNVGREQKNLREGVQWCAVQLMLKLEESDFPYTNNFKEVSCVMALPPAALDSHTTNPNHIDTTIVETGRRIIRGMYESGDIVDENQPIEEKTAPVTYAKSSIAAKVKGPKEEKAFGKGWEHIQMRKQSIPIDQVSDDPEDDDDSFPSLSNFQAGPSEILPAPPEPSVKKERKGVSFNEFNV